MSIDISLEWKGRLGQRAGSRAVVSSGVPGWARLKDYSLDQAKTQIAVSLLCLSHSLLCNLGPPVAILSVSSFTFCTHWVCFFNTAIFMIQETFPIFTLF